MRYVKHILTGVAIVLGLFVVITVVVAFLTLPHPAETPATVILSTQNKETEEEVPSVLPGAENTTASDERPETVSRPSSIAYESLVNILCFTTDDGLLRPISGSGVIIDPRGVILTTAHIAQYFLLETHAECVVRQGSPASTGYQAELLYLPPIWIEENASLIDASVPRGTGEHDYAFLYITEGLLGASRPATFSSVTPDPRATLIKTYLDDTEEVELDVGTSVFVLGYPSEFLESMTVLQRLFPLFAQATVTQLFTFNSNTLDLISLQGNPLAQQGASGGAVIGSDGLLKALVVTASRDGVLSDRSLQAITLSHIERSLEAQHGTNIKTFLETSPGNHITLFATTHTPRLMEILTRELEK